MYKDERMPIFFHYCGVLVHDLRYCPTHFVALKKENPINYQYGDWLKADSGWSKSQTCQSKDSPPRAASMGRIDEPTKESNGVHEMVMAMTRAPSLMESRNPKREALGLEVLFLRFRKKSRRIMQPKFQTGIHLR